MEMRRYGFIDRFVGQIDKAIKVLAAPSRSSRAMPPPQGEDTLDESERRESARLMRVNHAGEVAAQALYQGQAFTAASPDTVAAMQHAAAEETDHLAWCERRLGELGGKTSLLNPLWYAGSFAIGAAAGIAGDRASLGFVAETERQVEQHLRGHLERMSAADRGSRAVLEQMKHDEARHGAHAAALGGAELPVPVRAAMRWIAKLMTHGSYWI